MNLFKMFPMKGDVIPFVKADSTGGDGLACASMLCIYYKIETSPEKIKRKFPSFSNKMNMENLVELFSFYKKPHTAYQCDVSELSAVEVPAILYWENCRFVVLAKKEKSERGESYIVFDPSTKKRRYPSEELEIYFSGVILVAD
ncbi:cysteine peptidase family C39 domain-containing protein [Teredinibacter purpureus]|uniref:cysteine peptidase family C39 domain-containing protein n=1 Tax=Teredinibacter purpureus TaxID=2731756 RepID=UPI0005F7E915|nr:cysteine peptidase family C39 domain-containing protein [Teredinibacter purpureus]